MPGFLKKKRTWFGLLLVIVLGVGFMLFQSAAKTKKEEQAKAAATKVESPYAAIANGKVDVEGGIIQIAARRGGIVREVLVQEGERVTAGQILARQEDDEPRLAVQSAAAAVAQAESQLNQIRVDIRTAQREQERLQRLAATNFVAAQRVDQAADAVATAQARMGSQVAAVQTARAQLDQARYNQELTVIRAPSAGRIVRRYANPGAGASTLNVSTMFDLEPDAPRIVRAEVVESDLPNLTDGQAVEISPEGDSSKIYIGTVLRRAAVFGARKLASDDPSQRTDERVVEVVASAGDAPLLIGQRVLVKFMKPGETAGAKRQATTGVGPAQAMRSQ
ncbi:HlyD family secretion protein [Brevundimonas nasdae]|jgi:HlyD family secretion protein|uniref:Biotin/lipoyl-binding protein n=1 Tax=Brevundimonas nasdae TaxID=172043 RepID=A0ABX8TGS1_9CAUL|nr:HlyD family efflux transporter periplasmic adaptor subunit [Brevundimonas nasdae]MBK6023845.1 biotin/lipoyl-binding protein [Brevundimonas nasdae]MDQ0450498.1 HlyD family secretion protein [Brevundimonas nasdae]QYC09000.1 biotin/lipoyl-binding protein [Brevundimonas nasdae]QYC15050.1 biotin/lipoyl-binding protein [Brevundimonas nasdae]